MPESKPKPPTSTKPGFDAKPAEPGLEVKPVTDLEPDDAQSGNVRGGIAKPGKLFSDAALKTQVSPFRGALAKLLALRF